MQKNKKNILVILVIASVAVGGYYFYAQAPVELTPEVAETQVLFSDVQRYAERFQKLNEISLSTELFSDPYFRSLVSYSTPVPPQPIGRTNPFDPVIIGAVGSF